MNKVKYWIIRSLIFITILLLLCFVLALIYAFVFGSREIPILTFIIIGGGGFYCLVFANKTSIRITNHFVQKNHERKIKKGRSNKHKSK